ncbi:MAG: repeat-like domain [Frankiaceae bacterium]|nr:repeat-like domain [Frankiaceae bacterium]
MSRRWRWAAALPAALLAVAPVAVSMRPAAAAPGPCLVYGEQSGAWSRVPVPAGAVAVDQFDGDPCVLVAADSAHRVWRSADGGRDWRVVTTAPRAVTRVLAERLGRNASGTGGRVVLALTGQPAGPAMLVSTDGGTTFAPASTPGLDAPVAGGPVPGGEVVAAAGSADGAATYAAATPLGLVKSTDGGRTFLPLPGAASLRATGVAVSPADPDEVWLVAAAPGTPAALWVSRDAGLTFAIASPVGASVADADVTLKAGGGARVLAATGTGLIESTDGGTTWTALAGGGTSGVRAERSRPAEVVAVAGGRARSSSDGGRTFGAPVPGLPASCAPQRLRAGASDPGAFLAECAGVTYRLRVGSLGRDDGGPGPVPTGSPPPPPPPAYVGTPLKQLRSWPLPVNPDSSSGSIGFDGRVLYYTDMNPLQGRKPGTNVLHRLDALTGRILPDITTGLPFVDTFTYDSRRHQLDVNTDDALVAYDLRTGAQQTIFEATGAYYRYSYNVSTDSFLGMAEYSGTLTRISRAGRRTTACTYEGADARFQDDAVGVTSAMQAAGDGGAYIQLEDDQTLVRIDGACRETGVYSHRVYSESTGENDGLACDAVTFYPLAAIWIRDAQPPSVTAYQVPYGYCPLATKVAVTAPRSVDIDGMATVCAGLTIMGSGRPVAGRQVRLDVGGANVGSPSTDADGRACARYHPAQFLGGVAGAFSLDQPIVARFRGDNAFLGSDGRGSIAVTGAAVVAKRPPVAGVPVPVEPPTVRLPDVRPIAEPQPVPQVQPQVQPQPNPQPNAQGQAQAQAAAVPQKQEQVQVAGVQVQAERAEHAIVRRRRTGSAPFGAGVAVVAMFSAAYATAMARRTAPVRRH